VKRAKRKLWNDVATRAIGALCFHVSRNGSFAEDGRLIARVFLEMLDVPVDEWREEDAEDYGRRASLARLRAVCEEIGVRS